MPWGGSWGAVGIVGLTLGLVFFVGLLAALGFGVVWVVRRQGSQARDAATENPLEIAQRRLATGEIGVAEFEQIRDRLRL